jgi:hypothetical protein
MRQAVLGRGCSLHEIILRTVCGTGWKLRQGDDNSSGLPKLYRQTVSVHVIVPSLRPFLPYGRV